MQLRKDGFVGQDITLVVSTSAHTEENPYAPLCNCGCGSGSGVCEIDYCKSDS
jgi:hypothetical protein